MMSQQTFRVHPDVVGMAFGTISNDTVIKSTAGVVVDKVLNRKVLATTPAGGQGNVRIAVSKQRTAKFEWNAGGLAGQQRQFVKIDIAARVVEGQGQTARDLVDGLKRRIEEIMFSAIYFGQGWLGHSLVHDGYPSAPLGMMAYNFLVYEFNTTMGSV
jgi:hypothetical protein